MKNSFIVSMPQLSDGELHNSVILLCKHDKEGSVGFVVNQPVKDLSIYSPIGEFLGAEVERRSFSVGKNLLWGGSVDAGRIWIIHSLDQSWPHTVKINRQCGVTANMETIDDILSGKKTPRHYLLLMGRVEWKAGILDKEIQKGLWLNAPFDRKVLFSISCQWDILMGRLGTDRLTLSPQLGSA